MDLNNPKKRELLVRELTFFGIMWIHSRTVLKHPVSLGVK